MIGVIVNENARRVRRDRRLLERLAGIAGAGGATLAVTTSAVDVGRAVAGFAAGGVDLVAACGGDGTIGGVLGAVREAYPAARAPRFAILPAGTMNTIARNAGIGGPPDRALRALLAAQGAGAAHDARTVGTLTVDGRPAFIFGAALAARLLEHYYAGRTGVPRALGMALRVPLSALFGTALARRIFAPVPARVIVDGRPLPVERYTLLVAATVRDVGLGVRVTYRADEDVERFQLVASALPPRALARQFGRTFRGRPLRGAEHYDLLARRAEIHFTAAQPCTIDGELLQARQVELVAGQRIRLCGAS